MGIETEGIVMFGSTMSLIILSAVISGIAYRTIGKFVDKWRAGEIEKFESKYIGTAIAAFIAAIIPAMAFMPQATLLFTGISGEYGVLFAWLITAIMAYGTNEGINYTWKRVEGKAEETVLKSGKLDKLIDTKVEKILAKKQKEE